MDGPRNNLDAMLARLPGGPGRVSSGSTGGSKDGGSERAGPSSKPIFTLARAISAGPSRSVMPTPSSENGPSSSIFASGLPSKAVNASLRTGRNETLGSAILTPQSLNGSPVLRGGLGIEKPAASMPKAGSAVKGSANKLDSFPLEKLQAMIIKNQQELLDLMLQKQEMAEQEDDWSGDDPEMMEMKMTMISKRLKDLKAALAVRTATPRLADQSNSNIIPRAEQTQARHLQSSGTTDQSANRAMHNLPAENAIAGPSRSYEADLSGQRAEQQNYAVSDDEEEIPLAQLKRPSSRVSTDIAAEEPTNDAEETQAVHQRRQSLDLPPSTPPQEPLPADMMDLDDLPPEAFIMSSPITQPPPRVSASAVRSFEAGSSSSRMAPAPPLPATQGIGGPGLSSSAVKARSLLTRPADAQPVKFDVKHPWSKEVDQKLKQIFRLPRFRLHQKEAVDETMAGKDVFVLMPTGGGKSLTYQLPAVCSTGKTKGVTFVISPLISLIADQTRHLLKLDIPAIAYTGDMTAADKAAAHEALSERDPWTKVVYVTPEMMSMGGRIKGIMRSLASRQRLARFVIDEAHCVSQWGHDFRSDCDLRKEYPQVPIMALTATAQIKVQEDIIRSLRITGCAILRQSFNRPNLNYEVRPKTKTIFADIVQFIHAQKVDKKHTSGIIYCASRDKCELIAKELREKQGLRANHYHAGMSKGDRRKMQEGWQEHEFEIIVATVAFGMGIDKPDVRFVIHHSLPRSLEGYYQETGRGGRDGNPSKCILYYSYKDAKTVTQLIDKDKNLTQDQKTRQKDAISQVLRFCMNQTDCRRSQVLSFFNETFDPTNCHGGCDVCLSRDQKTYSVEDVTLDAVSVLKMVRHLHKEDRVTVIAASEIWLGVNKASTRNFSGNPFFGAGKEWERQEAERLIQWMLTEKALEEFSVQNNAGWSNSYIKLGSAAKDFLQGKRTLTMDFRQKSPSKTADTAQSLGRTKSTTKVPSRKNGQSNIDDFAQPTQRPLTNNPISRKRSLQQIEAENDAFDNSKWGDTDNEDEDEDYRPDYQKDEVDPIVLSGDETEMDEDEGNGNGKKRPVAKKRKSVGGDGVSTSRGVGTRRKDVVGDGLLNVGKAGPSSSSSGRQSGKGRETPNRADNRTPVEKCLLALQEVVKKEYEKNKHAPVLPDYALEMLATTMPTNYYQADIKDMNDLEKTEGITSAHIKHYGGKILGATIKHLRLQEIANGITPGGIGSRIPPGPARRARVSAPAGADTGTANATLDLSGETSQSSGAPGSKRRLTLPPSTSANSAKGAGPAKKPSTTTTTTTMTPAAVEPKQVVASIQSYAYKPKSGSFTLPITAFATSSSSKAPAASGGAVRGNDQAGGDGSGSGSGSGSGHGEKRITLSTLGKASARPKF